VRASGRFKLAIRGRNRVYTYLVIVYTTSAIRARPNRLTSAIGTRCELDLMRYIYLASMVVSDDGLDHRKLPKSNYPETHRERFYRF
jgi:hypothetical protein